MQTILKTSHSRVSRGALHAKNGYAIFQDLYSALQKAGSGSIREGTSAELIHKMRVGN